MDATVPVIAFVVGLTVAQAAGGAQPVAWASGAAVLAALVLGGIRMVRGRPPRAVAVGLLGVAVAAVIALYTGRAVDFFLIQIVANAVSAMVWAVSILVRWPLLGLVVGAAWGSAPGGGGTRTWSAATSGPAGSGSRSTCCGWRCSCRSTWPTR